MGGKNALTVHDTEVLDKSATYFNNDTDIPVDSKLLHYGDC